MPVPAFPLAKLGAVLIKQVSKPIANGIANRARKSKLFRDYVCIPVAQFFHWYDVKIRMRVLNLGKVTSVPKLDEKKAIETGAQLLSEFILVVIASGIIVIEYTRQSEKDEVKKQAVEQEKAEVRDQITNLEFTVAKQSAEIRELTRLTIAIRDDLQKVADTVTTTANKSQNKKSSFFGGGGDDNASGSSIATSVTPIPDSMKLSVEETGKDINITEVANTYYSRKPISLAVHCLHLYAA